MIYPDLKKLLPLLLSGLLLGFCLMSCKPKELESVEKQAGQLELALPVILPLKIQITNSQQLIRQPGSWQIIRFQIRNLGEDIKGTIRGREAASKFGGEIYEVPFEIAQNSLKEVDLKIPGVTWVTWAFPKISLSIHTNRGSFQIGTIPLAGSSQLIKNCWVLSNPSASKSFLLNALKKLNYDIEETSPSSLPRSWVGYQTVELVVLLNETLESIDPSQAEALKIYSEIGGRVLLFTGAKANFDGNHILGTMPQNFETNDFPSGLKKVVGYEITPEVNSFLKPRAAHLTLLTAQQSASYSRMVARSLAPEIPSKSTILLLLFLFFMVALVGNRLFCNYLKKPELTYPIFLVLSIVYFFGVYSLGWQVEDHSVKRRECSFAYIPPVGELMYVRSIECLISGKAQQIKDIKLPKNNFVFPQTISEEESFGASTNNINYSSGTFQNSQFGEIKSTYLKPKRPG